MDHNVSDSILESLSRESGIPLSGSVDQFLELVASRMREIGHIEQKSRQVAETLRVASIEISRGLDPGAILESLLDYLGWVVIYDRAMVLEPDPLCDFRVRAERNYEQSKEGSLKDDGLLSFERYAAGKAFGERTTVVSSEGLFICLAVPIVVHGEPIAVLLLKRLMEREFDENELKFTNALASQAAVALENAALFKSVSSSERYFRTLIEKSNEIITLFDDKTRITYMSPSGIAVLSDLGPAVDGALFSAFLHRDDRSRFMKGLQSLAKNDHGTEIISFRLGSDESPSRKYYEGSIRDLRDDDLVRSFVMNWRDVTERKNSERIREAIAMTAEKLREARKYSEMLPEVIDCVGAILDTGFIHLHLDSPESGIPEIKIDRGHAPRGFSTITAPFMVDGAVLGTIRASRVGDFSGIDISLLTAVADIAASAIRRAALYEQTESRLRRLEALRTIERAISTGRNLATTLDLILEQATLRLEVDAASVLLLDPLSQDLELVAGRGFRSTDMMRFRSPVGETYAGTVAAKKRMFKDVDIERHAKGTSAYKLFSEEGFVSYYGLPLLANGVLLGVLEIIHRSRLERGEEWESFLGAVAGQAAIAVDNATLVEGLAKANQDMLSAYDRTIEGWSRALELRDHETEGHTVRVAEMTLRMAEKLGIPEERMLSIRRGALLHDIGKIGIPDSILLKPGPLSSAELTIMQKHTSYARELLGSIDFLNGSIEIPYCHHEKWDGTGYPDRLMGTDIPYEARIFAVIDVWDALTSDRPYHAAWDKQTALSHIIAASGTHFDPEIVETFVSLIRQIEPSLKLQG